jgi:myo-inositol-1-phosphate synthase
MADCGPSPRAGGSRPSPAAPIRVAVVGVGNCCSAFVQGVSHYRSHPAAPGVTYADVGGYAAADVVFVAAWDVDERKVGRALNSAVFAPPNCCFVIDAAVAAQPSPVVRLAPALDGVAPHMLAHEPAERSFRPAAGAGDSREAAAAELRAARADVLVNYLPVGSQRATEFWAQVCLDAEVPLLNCIPVFIASDPAWEAKFAERGLPLIGDDMRSQFGASVLSQMLQELAFDRGHVVKAHIQQNVGGNTDFLNSELSLRRATRGGGTRAPRRLPRGRAHLASTLTSPSPPTPLRPSAVCDKSRLASKKESKENVIRAQNVIRGVPTEGSFLFAGPSDYISFYGDTKVATFRLELEGFGGAPAVLDARLQVQDSPNSAGVVIDAIRFLKVARELGVCGSLRGASAFTQKTPPAQLMFKDAKAECDALARRELTDATRSQVRARAGKREGEGEAGAAAGGAGVVAVVLAV